MPEPRNRCIAPAGVPGVTRLNARVNGARLARPTVQPPIAVLVEVPDPDGRRWQQALEILLEAGRVITPEAEPRA